MTFSQFVRSPLAPLFSLLAVALVAVPTLWAANVAPQVTSFGNATFSAGVPNIARFTASGTPTPSLILTGSLPSWANVDMTAGTISGTPPVGTDQSWPILLTATNTAGSANQNFVLHSRPLGAPVIALASRMQLSSSGGSLIFSIAGGSRTILLRAAGPTLGSFGISGFMTDPQIQLLNANSGAVLQSNDNWNSADSATMVQVGAFMFNAGSRDASLVVTLGPGVYRAKVSGVGQTTGVALLEFYDVAGSSNNTSHIPYLAVHGPVSTGGEIMSVGLTVGGTGSTFAMMRAIGRANGMDTALPNPNLTLYSGSTSLATNDNWGSGNVSDIRHFESKSGAAPLTAGSLDSVLYWSLSPGSYNAQVTAATGPASGAAQFEIFPGVERDADRPLFIDVGSGVQTLYAGQAGTLAPAIYGMGQGLTYQWRKNGSPILGATSATLTFANPTTADQDSYDLVVTGSAGTITSGLITVTVVVPILPSFVSQPASGLYNIGNAVRFAVVCDGTLPLSYQWRRNGVPISNATKAELTFRAESFYDVGAYDVVVTNVAGSATSRRATLSIGQLPLPTTPAAQYVRLGDSVTLGAHAPETTIGLYSWYKDDAAVNRATVVYDLEGVARGEIPAGLTIPDGRWNTQNGGALYTAGLISSQSGLVVGAGNGPTYVVPNVTNADLGQYSVGMTVNSVTERRGPAPVALRGTTGLGRRFLAVDGAGRVSTSLDGQTWTGTVVGPRDLSGVAVKGDVAVAVGRLGAVQRSTDLVTWTLSTNGIQGTELNSVVAGPDRFVTVGEGGGVFVSADGLDWYRARIVTTTSLRGVTYGNGVYVMTGANGAIFASTDGFNWVNRNSQTTSEILFATFAGTQFWALTVDSQLLTSPDGLTWSRTETVQPAWFRSLAYDGTSLVAVGTEGRIYTSSNGIAWTLRTSGTSAGFRAITWSGVEVPSGFNPASILSNLDFSILTPPRAVTAAVGQSATFSVTTSGAPTSYQWYKGGEPIGGATGSTYTILSVQAGDVGGYSVKITSAAGEITSSTAGLQLRGGGTLGSQFIAVGDNGVILTSTDGLQFTDRTSRPTQIFRAVAASAFGAVAVGRANLVATSSDGINWSYRNLSLPGDYRVLRGVTAGPSQFVAVGSTGTIIVSFDSGDTWKLVASGTTQGLWGVAWNGSRFVAVGEGGVVLTSLDGLTWAAGTSPTSQRLYGIHADGSRFIAATELGAAYETSNSAVTWSAASVSGDLWARGVAVANTGRRVIVGDRGMISTSAGGSVWNLSASPVNSRLYGVTWTGILGNVGGDVATAIQAPTLRILSQPQPVAGFVGGTASFSVSTGGVGPYDYQWLKNGVELSQQTQSTLLLSNLQPADAGSYSVEVRNASSVVTSTSAALTVSVGSGSAPTLASSPASRSVSVGGATNFVVVADGQAPLTYRWYFNGNPISGAVSATLPLSNVQMANAGSYTVTVSNRYGSVTSAPAALTVTSVPGMPVISQQPASQAVAVDGVAVFSVVATGTPAPSYQWRKDGVDINGATQATYAVDPVATANAGVYTVRVSNIVAEVISEPASLTVVPAGTTASHRQTAGRGYEAGGSVTIASTLTFVGQAQSAGWEVLLPAGWSYVSGGGAQGDIRPAVGETQLLSWAWTTPPASPITFTYTLQVPLGTTGAQALAAMAVLRQGGVPIRLMAQPDPLIIAPASTLHAADTSGDQRIDLFELTRVIELYNTRNGSVRTGAYRVDSAGEDGFAGDATRAANSAATLTRYHSADTRGTGVSVAPDGALDLLELTRIIELYNHRAGNVRTGQYRVQSGTEDGFTPGP